MVRYNTCQGHSESHGGIMDIWTREYLIIPRHGLITIGWRHVVIKLPTDALTVTLYASRDYKWKFIPVGHPSPRLVIQKFGEPGETTYHLTVVTIDENDIPIKTERAEYLGLAAVGMHRVDINFVFR